MYIVTSSKRQQEFTMKFHNAQHKKQLLNNQNNQVNMTDSYEKCNQQIPRQLNQRSRYD